MEPDGLEPTTPALQTRFLPVWLLLLPNLKTRKKPRNAGISRSNTTLSSYIIFDLCESRKPLFRKNNPYFGIKPLQNPYAFISAKSKGEVSGLSALLLTISLLHNPMSAFCRTNTFNETQFLQNANIGLNIS